MRVIHLVRSVGPTSMPWNDLYATARRLAPGMMYPPSVISPGVGLSVLRWSNCRGAMRRYLACNPIGGIGYVVRLYRRSSSANRVLLIHVHNPALSWLALFVKILCPKIRVVGNLHSDWSFLKRRHRLGLNILARISHHFICVSRASMNSVPVRLRARLQREGRLSVIKNGIDSQAMELYMLERMRQDSASFVRQNDTAVVVARMVEPKNCLFVLRILAATSAISRLVWFGDGIQRKEIESEIIRLGIGQRISLLGNRPRDDVFRELSEDSLYISASKWEGIGVANLEAAALGCWPFLSSIPPHQEIADTLGIGTYPLDDVAKWTEAIEAYLALPILERQAMQSKLSETARRIYDIKNMVAAYINVYRKLGESVNVSQ